MRIILQRVKEASVTVNKEVVAKIDQGLLILLGVEAEDTQDDIDWLCRKTSRLRIFSDEQDAMNYSIQDVGGDVIVVSQFTLHASTKKGNRPSFVKAAKPDFAEDLYQKFTESLEKEIGKKVQTGVFGAMMDVQLINDGPVTIFIDSKKRE